MHLDSSPLLNVVSGLGTARDPNEYMVVRNRRSRSRAILSAYYRSSWACKRVVELLPRLMTRRWGQLVLGGDNVDPSILADYEKIQKDLSIVRSFRMAQTWANLFGNAAIVLAVNDGQEDYSQPIDEDNIIALEGIDVFDRYYIYPDFSDPLVKKTKPEYYRFFDTRKQTTDNKIHRSRVLWFRGTELPDNETRANGWCDDSVLEPFIDAWHRFYGTYAAAGEAVERHDEFIHKIDGLFEGMINGGKEYEAKIKERIATNNAMRSVYRGSVIDKEKEELDFLTRELGNIDSIFDKMLEILVAASGFPRSVLTGQFAAGLDASGKTTGEQKYLNDLVEEGQNDKFQDQIYWINYIILRSREGPTRGELPDDWGWGWHPLYQQTAEEKAQEKWLYAQIDEKNITSQLYTGADARSRYTSAHFNSELILSEPHPEPLEPELPEPLADPEPTVENTITVEDADPPIKHVIDWNGLKIGVTHMKGDRRYFGIMQAGYGHLRGTWGKGKDKKAVDLYLGDNLNSSTVWKIRQLNKEGFHDEDKFIIGIDSAADAKAVYLKHVSPRLFGGIEPSSVDELKSFLPEQRQDATEVQSLLIPVTMTAAQAKRWAKSYNFKYSDIDTTDKYHRFRQFEPDRCSSSPRTIDIDKSKGIKAIICNVPLSIPNRDSTSFHRDENAEPFQKNGTVLGEKEFERIADDLDIDEIVGEWKERSPDRFAQLLDAD